MSQFEHHTISVHYAQAVLNAVSRCGVDAQNLLQEVGLNPLALEHPDYRITPELFSDLMRRGWELTNDEWLGMGASACRHGVFTLMAKEAVRSRNLRAVLQHICRFYNLVNDAFTLSLSTQERTLRLEMEFYAPEQDPDHLLAEFLLLLWHRFPSWLIGQRIPLQEVWFTHSAPAHANEYRLLFPCPIKFDQPTNALIMENTLLEAPVIQRTRTLKSHLRRAPLDWFTRQAFFSVYTRRILDYLERQPNFSEIGMDEIASRLHMTERTLRRKLTLEGTSFQKIKDSIRRDMAIHLLSQPALSITQISQQLGFSEPTAFTRAFRHWTGDSPRAFRAVLLDRAVTR